jgi:hypothetical protein
MEDTYAVLNLLILVISTQMSCRFSNAIAKTGPTLGYSYPTTFTNPRRPVVRQTIRHRSGTIIITSPQASGREPIPPRH